MAFIRSYRDVRNSVPRILTVKVYRHRGAWAFYEGSGWMWRRESGFKSALAALRAASRWLKGTAVLMRR